MMKELREYVNDLFYGTTLDRVIANDLEAAQREQRDSEHVILTHQFQLHMVRARIAALKAWDDQQLKERGSKTAQPE